MISIQIQFDKTSRTYNPGEEVVGKVNVQVEQECQCNQLVLIREWRTHGKGNKQSGGKQTTVLSQGELWSPGMVRSFRFRFNAPLTPVTYHGHYLNVDWYVRVKAEMPWGIDRLVRGALRHPRHEEEFLLLPEDQPFSVTRKHVKKRSFKLQRTIAWLFLAFGLIYMYVLAFGGSTGSALIGIVPLIIGGFILLWVIPRSSADKKLGEVGLLFEPTETRDGIVCKVRIVPKEEIHLEGMHATLLVREVVTSGSGTSRTTRRHELYKVSTEKEISQTIYPNLGLKASIPFKISKDLPVSLDITDNEIQWSLALRLDLSGWLVWKRVFPLRVYRGSQVPSIESRLGMALDSTEDSSLRA
ncbi:MAG: hypothetical protein GTO14_08490 [Anaerolineales bacterium]|nr:hypothetical protein [Anaerolineales bacterium]